MNQRDSIDQINKSRETLDMIDLKRAERIKEVILSCCTYEEMEEKTGISKSTLFRMATGKNDAKLGDIAKIASVTNTSMNYITFGCIEEYSETGGMPLLRKINSLTSEEKELSIKLIESLSLQSKLTIHNKEIKEDDWEDDIVTGIEIDGFSANRVRDVQRKLRKNGHEVNREKVVKWLIDTYYQYIEYDNKKESLYIDMDKKIKDEEPSAITRKRVKFKQFVEGATG